MLGCNLSMDELQILEVYNWPGLSAFLLQEQ